MKRYNTYVISIFELEREVTIAYIDKQKETIN